MDETSDVFLLGIDIGTTGTKCAIYKTDGQVAAHAYYEYPMVHPQPGWTEQKPDIWWQAVRENLHQCFEREKIDASRIAAISVSCTNAVMIVDKNGDALYNAIGHHDTRADAQVIWLQQHVGEDKILSVTANQLAKGSFALPTVRWFIDNKPNLIRKAEKILLPSGFIIHKLTGVFSINRPRASLTLLADAKTGQWSSDIVKMAEIPERLLPDIYEPTAIVGTVTEKAALLTGLKAGIPVTAGCLDTVAATFGSGAVHAGDTAITLGSSGRICYISDKPIYDKRLLNCFSPCKGLYTIIQTTDNAGISMRWFRDVFGKKVADKACRQDKSVYEYFNVLAEHAAPGAGGIIYLPYLSGEKSPIWNPKARGVFWGMSLESSYGDFVRAVMEGVAFSIKDCFNILEATGHRNKNAIPLGGGIANSRIWCQILADVLQRPLLRLKFNETETLGDMILAGLSIRNPSIDSEFGKKIANKGDLIKPDSAKADLYARQFDKYKKIYEQVKDLF